MSSWLLVLVLLLSFSTSHATPFFAARCVARSFRCRWWLARRSGVCRPRTFVHDQPLLCLHWACRYCRYRMEFRIRKYPCKKRVMKRLCTLTADPSASTSVAPSSIPSTTPSLSVTPTSSTTAMASITASSSPSSSVLPSPSSSPSESVSTTPSSSTTATASISSSMTASSSSHHSPSPSPSQSTDTSPSTVTSTQSPSFTSIDSCTWHANADGDAVVIPFLPQMATDGWVPIIRDGLNGLVYEPTKNHGIDWRGAKGKMCFNVKVKIPGGYYFTALSYAPHNTEYNDMWVQSSLGFELWKGGKNGTLGGVVKSTEWRKAYQNYGIRGISDDLKTIDFNGHRFIIPVVKSDTDFQVCVSGRSYRYEVFRLILVKCKGVVCTGGAWVLKDLPERPLSTCV